MMTIGKVTSNTIHPTAAVNTSSAAASNTKNIQNQISTKEQNLNRLSSDSKLSAEEKEKKRQEIQKELDELNRKLELMRMKQEEAEKTESKKQEKEDAIKEELKKTSSKKQTTDSLQNIDTEEEQKHIDMPIEDVQKMLTADYALQKEIAEKKVSSQTESTINVLKSEIKQDKLYGTDTTSKKEEIASIREKENFWTEPKEQEETQILSPIDPNAKIIIQS